MVDLTGPNDEQSVNGVEIDPDSNNPIEVDQTSNVETFATGGIDDDGFEVSVSVTGANIAEQINIAVVIDTSGSAAGSSGTDFDGDGNNETILEAELFAAQELFDAYVAAGHDPAEITISLVTYSSGSQVVGSFSLDDPTAFSDALQDISDAGPGGLTNYEAGLGSAGDAFDAAGADPADTNIVVFMSDGFPFPSGQDIPGAAGDLVDDWNAQIQGIGVGANSSLNALNQLDNTGGADQVLSGDELLDIIVEPLTDADFLRFEIVIEGVDENGDPVTQTIVVPEGDPNVITTQLGWTLDCLEIDPIMDMGQDVTITFHSYFAEDPGDPGSGEQIVTTQHLLTIVPCFTPGTNILTPDGPVAIETLEIGDRVITRDHGMQMIRWIGATTLSAGYIAARPDLRPVLIRKDALGVGQPEQDMRLSRQHRILVRDWRAEMMFGVEGGVLVPAHSLCNDSSVLLERPSEDVTYIHMAFDDHEVVYADGIESESFHPGERMVSALNSAQRDELIELFPELEQQDGFAYASARPQPRAQEARVLGPQVDTQGDSV
ncbi:MAG: Hint domain-containing protein [Rhodobacteraceae bacterium]|nr:Hint domain-containing protein [Paracoccaceae bacterium]